MADQPNPPAVMCNLVTCKPSTMGRGWFESEWDVFILVASVNDRSDQKLLRSYLDPTGTNSVWVAFGLNNDLDLTDGTRATLVDYRTFSIEEVAVLPYYGGVLSVTVTTPGV